MRRPALLLPLVLLLAACSSGTPKPVASGLPGLRTLAEDPSHEHREGRIRYGEQPPLGGPHDPRWLRCEVYTEPVPDEFAVHSMEHGGVWLAYRPGTDVGPLQALKDSSDAAREYVLASPIAGLRAPVVAVTWGASLDADGPTDPRLAQFVKTYAGGGQGGEKGVPCTSSPAAVTPQEAERLLDRADGQAGRTTPPPANA